MNDSEKLLNQLNDSSSIAEVFDLTDRVAIITGGSGLLGRQHARAIAEMGGIPILLDKNSEELNVVVGDLEDTFNGRAYGYQCDITSESDVTKTCSQILSTHKQVDILINNAANNPTMGEKISSDHEESRLEHFPLASWEDDIRVGLTGSFLCSRCFGDVMAKNKKGVILNIGSDLSLIGPDQRIYQDDKLDNEDQVVKPVSYSVVKSGLLGLTKYLATYWATTGLRVNLLAPGGVYVDQNEVFVQKLTSLIPLGRMAQQDEYKAAVVFLVSDASSYMTGAVLSVDGGRTCW